MTLLNQLLGYGWFITTVGWICAMVAPRSVQQWLFGSMYGRARLPILILTCIMAIVSANEFYTMTSYTRRLAQPMSHAEKLDAQRFKFHAERNFYMDVSICTLLVSAECIHRLFRRNGGSPDAHARQ